MGADSSEELMLLRNEVSIRIAVSSYVGYKQFS
jgi:hypothetical protein